MFNCGRCGNQCNDGLTCEYTYKVDQSGYYNNYGAGTKYENEKFLTAGGRVLNVTATGNTLKEALDQSYSCVKKINFKNHHYRNDIGAKALMASDK